MPRRASRSSPNRSAVTLRGSAEGFRRQNSGTTSASARSKVTYRPLIFLDTDHDGYSAHVANAMFLAAEDRRDATTEHSSSALSRSCGAIRNGPRAGRAHRRRNGRDGEDGGHAGQRRRADRPRRVSRSTSRKWKTPTTSTCTRSTRCRPAHQRFTTRPADQKLDIYDNEWLVEVDAVLTVKRDGAPARRRRTARPRRSASRPPRSNRPG